ncbi:MAG: hypothetical protein VX278_23295 [Myxococcota bacterium]|nr:hypothetical protein [Myxococcota bacterium]
MRIKIITILPMAFFLIGSGEVFAQDDLSEEELEELLEAEENATVIEGKDYTPSLEVLSRGVKMDKNYEIPLEESFIPKIKDTMKKLPF